MHESLAHASTEHLRHIGIQYIHGNCDYCILSKQIYRAFPINPSLGL